MIGKARGADLRFCDDQLRVFEELSNVHGTVYDSRSGVAGYYRYGPRSLEKLCDDDRNGVHLKLRLVHDSVTERIAARTVAYSPLSLPRDLTLTVRGGTPVMQDGDYVDFAWDAVFWRRITYFATVFLTAILVLSPWLPLPTFGLYLPRGCEGPGPCERWPVVGWLLWVAHFFFAAIPWLYDKLLGLVPSWAHGWVVAFRENPIFESVLIGALGWLFLVQGSRLQRNIAERSELAWAEMKLGARETLRPKRGLLDKIVYAVRTWPPADAFGRFWDEKLIPNLVGSLLLIVLLSTGLVAVCEAFSLLCGFWLRLAVVAALTVTFWSYRTNVAYRNMIDEKLGSVRILERRWSYDASDLVQFKDTANRIPLADGRKLLQVYHGPVLLPNDLIFAVALGLFVTLFGRLLAIDLASGRPELAFLFHASAVLGLLYAAFDVAEDMTLARIFGSTDVPPTAAALAPWLTRAKMVCLACSVTGGILFMLLQFLGRRVPPAEPERF